MAVTSHWDRAALPSPVYCDQGKETRWSRKQERELINITQDQGISLVVWWLRFHLPMQEMQVLSVVRELLNNIIVFRVIRLRQSLIGYIKK